MSTEAGLTVAATLGNEITDVQYNIDAGKVDPLDPIIAVRAHIRNDSDAPVSQTVTYVLEKYIVGTWNDVDTSGSGTGQKFTAGVTFVTADLKISVTPPSEHEFGTSEGIKQSVTHQFVITVPPRSSGTVTVLVNTACIEVPFTYKLGGTQKNGKYKNLDTYDVKIVLSWD